MTPAQDQDEEQVLDAAGIQRLLEQLARQIAVRNHGQLETLALVGIHRRGVFLAERLRHILAGELGHNLPMGQIDITLYRDDSLLSHPSPVLGRTDFPFEVHNRHIVLVDDVLFTGRTVRAALDAIVDFGRPRTIQLAVLIDRGHREFPIEANYVGLELKTEQAERVEVKIMQVDGEEAVYLTKSPGKPERS